MKEINLDNLTRADFEELARYVQHLEEQLEGCKAAGITLMTQRNNLQKKLNLIVYQQQNGIKEQVVNRAMDIDFELVNPEQYRVPEINFKPE